MTEAKLSNEPTVKSDKKVNKYENLLRPVNTFLNDFFSRGPLHGISNLGKSLLHLGEKLMWISLITVSLYFCATLSLESWERFQTKSTVVTIEKDHYYWNISMPSLTICPMNRIEQDAFDHFCLNSINHKDEQKEIYNFIESLANSTYINFEDIKGSPNIDRILSMLRIEPKDYMRLIANLTKDLTRRDHPEFRVRSQNNMEYIRTLQTLTEFGICYTTNSFISPNLTTSQLLKGQPPDENYFYRNHKIHDVRFGNLFDGDITYSFIGFDGPVSVFYHSPYDTMNIARILPASVEAYEFEAYSIEIVTTEDFRDDTTVFQRGCRFPFESNLTHYKIYTKGTCRQECRLKLAYEQCGCIPHFYPNNIKHPKPVCDYKTLQSCFVPRKKLFLEFRAQHSTGESVECFCEQNCVDSKVIIEKTQVLKGTRKLLGSNGGLVIMKRYPLIRFSRQVLFTFTDLLVSIGGTAGFFLGFSVLGMVEIIYFFTLRLLWYILGHR
ncbi:sodium channel protein Nach [Topomyia yanbarensis]|uniref:sodium channel protein Nach n=1 Tax=Topomyia yanbarensis TaxID=2498891 RepID=UPI00273AFFFA|nr:sodium channel protein Nach [Topomyia yanbarensis]